MMIKKMRMKAQKHGAPRKKASGQQVTMTPEEVTSYQEGVKELEEEEKKEQP